MDFNNYSYELRDVVSYMFDILANEFPTDLFTPEHLIIAILDTKKCHANMMLDNYLMSENMTKLRDAYANALQESQKPVLKDRTEKVVPQFNTDLKQLMTYAQYESDDLSSVQLCTEHVLLALLNPSNNLKYTEVFNKVGVDYASIASKCLDKKKNTKASIKGKKSFINNHGMNAVQNAIPFKGEASVVGAFRYVGNTLQKFSVNLNEESMKKDFEEVVGREREINQIINILSRRKKNNIILIGEGGVGKTAIIRKLAKMITTHNVPSTLDNKEIMSLNTTALLGGTNLRGMFEERVNGIFDDMKKGKNCILLIDNIHTVLKSGSKDKDGDMSDMLAERLDDGDIRVIGITNHREYRNCIENNPAISNKMQPIVIEPTEENETIDILNAVKEHYEDYHNVSYPEAVVRKCVSLSKMYVTNRELPDSAIDVLDSVGAYVSLKSNEDEELKELRKEYNELENEKSESLNHGEFEKIDKISADETIIKGKIKEAKKKLKNPQKAEVTTNDVYKVISDMSGVPVEKLSSTDKVRISKIDDTLKKFIIGQDDAIEEVCKVIKRNRAGLGNKGKPNGVFMFLGETGVGKTLLAKKIAEEIYGTENALIRLDMSEYSEKNSVAKLHGTQPGYIGYNDGGVLTNALKKRPYSVVLLDEIEKADESIYNLFLQIFDEGRITEGNGNKVNAKNSIFIMTSNIGVKDASELGRGVGFDKDETGNKRAIIEKRLKGKFSPEFLNRIDKIVFFNSLSEDNLKDIVGIELNTFRKRLGELNYGLHYDDSVVSYIHQEAMKQKEMGARPIARLIQDEIEDRITDMLLENDFRPEYEFSATCVDNELKIS